jgi:hypothetical protein
MFMVGSKRYCNSTISKYCRSITQESIKKMTEKYNLEKERIAIKIPSDNDDNSNNSNNPNWNFNRLLIFISVSSLMIYFYKKLK